MQKFISSERVASELMDFVEKILDTIGLGGSHDASIALYLIFVITLAIVSGCAVRWFVIKIVRRILNKHFKDFGEELAENKVLRNGGRMIPPLVLLSLIPFALNSDHKGTHLIILLTLIYTIITTVMAINSVLSLVWTHYNSHHNDKNLPLRGILNITRGGMWIVAVIVVISLVVDKSPMALLTGLGAFAAVLLLLFKKSILGLVAGIEMADNDMLRVGDWISIPGTNVNGIVIDVSLAVVKVRNWNHTVSMVPPDNLITNQFVNWRYMKETGTRQIEMSVFIDVNTVKPLSDDELHGLQTILPLLKDFIDVKIKQREAGEASNVFNTEAGVNGTIDTNLGLLRAYINLYLNQHPYIYTELMHMVRILQPTPNGYPLQVFAYVTTSDWAAYEAIQSDIFEHIAAVAPTFGLCLYEQPSGRSIYNIGQTDRENVPYNGNEKIFTPTPQPDTNKHPGFKQP